MLESLDVDLVVTQSRLTLVLDSIMACCPTIEALVRESVQQSQEVVPLCKKQVTACVSQGAEPETVRAWPEMGLYHRQLHHSPQYSKPSLEGQRLWKSLS